MRLRRIIEVLSHANADVVCLQECEYRTFRDDVVPAMSRIGYDGIAQEDNRPDLPTRLREASKHHREPRHHITATFWRRDVFVPVGDSIARSRTLTTVLRLTDRRRMIDDDESMIPKKATPTVAIVNAHLEGHPRRFLERTHQLQHALTDLARLVGVRRGAELVGVGTTPPARGRLGVSTIDGELNALIIAGDFNCELQSSACSTYLRMGRLGRQAGLGGVHGDDAIVLPPSLLGTTEATEVIHPIMEWGRALPEEAIADVEPHPFRSDGLTSAYPAWLGRDDPRSHFTFCSETSKRPVPGLDQIWYTSMTLERASLRRMFVDDSRLWERYFYDDVEAEKRREDERNRVLATGLPSPGCEYPSDHLPIGAIFNWKRDRSREYSSICTDGGEVGVLNVLDAEGNDIQQIMQNSELKAHPQEHALNNPREELDHLLDCCPYDSDEQQSDVEFVLSSIDPPLPLASCERPTPDQMVQLDARHAKKAQLLLTASSGVRPWLQNIWKASKQVVRWERQHLMERNTIAEKSKS
jgi:endonuclease/exonuclease/phosphatase family metal-dependent hydrolase